jgi:hypothetical protein
MGIERWNFAANLLWGKMAQFLLGAERAAQRLSLT